MAAESSSSSSSNTSADSYIGSLISLTSKSEIRYEGILYNINTEESSIGLRNVRSFGTEGRKKDGPQLLPSDKVYEYILFRGSDIKDLQVKSPPPVQTKPYINSDPAIIQSHYPGAAFSGPLTDLSSHSAQLGYHGSTFQGGLPLYQPAGNLGSWGPSPPPSASGSGLAMPMYWQGFYGPPNGLPNLHQQSLLRPPPGPSVPPSMQQPIRYSGFNASLPIGASNLPRSNMPAYPSPLVPSVTSSLNLTSTSLPASTIPSSLPMLPAVALTSNTLPSSMPNKAPNPAIPPANLSSTFRSLSILSASSPDLNAVVPPSCNKRNVTSAPTFPYQTISQPMSTTSIGTSGPIQTETPTPSLVTPGQLLQSGPAAVSLSQSSQSAHKDAEVVQVSPTLSSELPAPVPKAAQPPISPLPPPSHATPKMDGAPSQTRHNYYRGRGREVGSSRPLTKFTVDFDFMAMNEKFKKDEVWGHLGKSNKSHSKDKEEDGEDSDEDDFQNEDEEKLPKFEIKSVYNKDDFFDSLSCNALDNESNNGRRFSEQMRLDTETFGDFSRYRGGHGPGRGGRSRGSYYYGRGYGRGYGYVGRGRGRGVLTDAS